MFWHKKLRKHEENNWFGAKSIENKENTCFGAKSLENLRKTNDLAQKA